MYIPHPALKEFIWSISTVQAVLPGGIDEANTPYPPTPFQSLLFYCNDPISMGRAGSDLYSKQPVSVFTGPQVSRVNIKVHQRLSAIRVDFVPGGAYRLLGIPMHLLSDQGFDTLQVFGNHIKVLNEQLRNSPDLEAGKQIVERFLLRSASALKVLLPFDRAMATLMETNGKITIEDMASLSCLSLRQFERTCKERIGMNPKTYLRILRFSTAYRLREALPELKWTKIAYEAGYFDQMHMIRDFKEFAGVNPSLIDQQLLQTPLRMQKDLLA